MVCLLLAACSAPPQQSADSSADVADGRIPAPPGSEVIILDVSNGATRLKIRKKEGQSVYLKFSSGDYTRLAGSLSSTDSSANIRFSQMTMPNGEMDGPFGREISHDLPVRGDYLLRISESLMAGDPWGGEVDITIILTR